MRQASTKACRNASETRILNANVLFFQVKPKCTRCAQVWADPTSGDSKSLTGGVPWHEQGHTQVGLLGRARGEPCAPRTREESYLGLEGTHALDGVTILVWEMQDPASASRDSGCGAQRHLHQSWRGHGAVPNA